MGNAPSLRVIALCCPIGNKSEFSSGPPEDTENKVVTKILEIGQFGSLCALTPANALCVECVPWNQH